MRAQTDKPPPELRWGIIGCGDVCERKSGPAMRRVSGSSIVAVMRRDFAKAQDFAKRHGVRRAYASVDELLADPLVNAVYVAAPPAYHCELTIRAAESGRPVLVEKPMARTPEECQRMIRACALNGVLLMVAYYRRFFPMTRKLQELLADGSLGEVRHARVYLTFATRTSPSDNRAWRWIPEISGGGQLMDIGSHRLDILHCLFGPAAEATAWTDPHPPDRVEKIVSATVTYQSGVVLSLLVDEGMAFPEDCLEIQGTRGRAIARPFDTNLTVHTSAGGRRSYSFQVPQPSHLLLVEHFRDVLRGEASPLITGEEGMQANLVIDAIYRSAAERRAVAVEAPGLSAT
ncbi:MAG: Gfo/Idh/MocA family protein [Armatimonadota bacterium]